LSPVEPGGNVMKAGDKSMTKRLNRVKQGVFLTFVALGLAEICFGSGGWLVGKSSAQDSKKSASMIRVAADQKSGKTEAAMNSSLAKDKRQEPAMEGDQLTP